MTCQTREHTRYGQQCNQQQMKMSFNQAHQTVA